jgi:hypothetical protein
MSTNSNVSPDFIKNLTAEEDSSNQVSKLKVENVENKEFAVNNNKLSIANKEIALFDVDNVNQGLEKAFKNFLHSEEVLNLSTSPTKDQIEMAFKQRAMYNLTKGQQSAYEYDITAIKECLQELIVLDAKQKDEILSEISLTKKILADQQRKIFEGTDNEQKRKEVRERVEKAGDYIGNFIKSYEIRYNDNGYNSQTDLDSYEQKIASIEAEYAEATKPGSSV